VRHWAKKHELLQQLAQEVTGMRAALLRVVRAEDVSALNSDNLAFKDAFVRVIDTSEARRQQIAELLMKQGEEERGRGAMDKAACLFEKGIAARGSELCADDKAGRDRVIEMRRALLAVGGGGGGEYEGNAERSEAAVRKIELAADLFGQGKYEEAIKLFEESRDILVQVSPHPDCAECRIRSCSSCCRVSVLGWHGMCSLCSRFQWQVSGLVLYTLEPQPCSYRCRVTFVVLCAPCALFEWEERATTYETHLF
jgi:tetratricopeptide (TPR) repeat protein